ncbi:MAG: MATE family efflux transporter, partial [Flavobacteriales bacterium]|nr:MATE family efflux transporter [Flavobacteriales bacterium]
TKDPLVISAFKAIFWLLILAQPINAVAFTFDGVYKGLGKAKQLRNVLFFSTVTLFIPSIYIAEYLNLQLFGIWISLILWMIGRAAPLWWGFTRKIAPKDKP